MQRKANKERVGKGNRGEMGRRKYENESSN